MAYTEIRKRRSNSRGKNVPCEQCGKLVYVQRKRLLIFRFCSHKCHSNYAKQTIFKFTCEKCNKIFYRKLDHGRKARYCSRKCYSATKIPDKQANCKYCDKIFTTIFKKERNKYKEFCSVYCSDKFKATGKFVPCIYCGKKHYIPIGHLKRFKSHFCSEKCKHLGLKDELCGKSYKHGTAWHSRGEYWQIAGKRISVKVKGHLTRRQYKALHRIIVEGIIGRKLLSTEPIWHINRNNEDNRIENLYLFPTTAAMTKARMRNELPIKSNLV